MPPKMTYLKVVNNTPERITTRIYSVEDYDWGNDHDRPDRNFHERVIGPNEELVKPLCINTYATTSLYRMAIVFEDETRNVCRIDQGMAAASSRRDELFVDYVRGGSRHDAVTGISEVTVFGAVAMLKSWIESRERGIPGRSNEKYACSLSVKGDTVTVDVHRYPTERMNRHNY